MCLLYSLECMRVLDSQSWRRPGHNSKFYDDRRHFSVSVD